MEYRYRSRSGPKVPAPSLGAGTLDAKQMTRLDAADAVTPPYRHWLYRWPIGFASLNPLLV